MKKGQYLRIVAESIRKAAELRKSATVVQHEDGSVTIIEKGKPDTLLGRPMRVVPPEQEEP